MKFILNTLAQWFDNGLDQNKYKHCVDESIDWPRCIPLWDST